MADSKSITMKDVAREAGVALGTVSKVVNGIPVGKTYQRRVEDAIEKLGYHVNRQARALRSSKSNIVEVILPNLYNPFFPGWRTACAGSCPAAPIRRCCSSRNAASSWSRRICSCPNSRWSAASSA